MTIEIGTWAIPLAVTVVALIWANAQPQKDDFGIGGLVDLLTALIVSLGAWLFWAVVS